MGISPQQTYYNWLGRRKTGRCWLTAMKIQNADNLIKEKYKQGYEYLLPRDYKWLKQLIQLTIKLPFETKLQWIESVCLVMIRFVTDSVAQYQSF
jgi:hypothetical protein